MAERKAHVAKQAIIDEIKGKLDGAQSAVVIDYIGTTVEEANAIRKMLREANVDYTIYKNTLMKRAFEGTEFEALSQVLEGPSALAISKEDATAPARVLKKAIGSVNKMAFKGGVVEGNFYDAEEIVKVANIPSRDELIAKFLGSIQSPVGAAVRMFAAIRDAKADGSFGVVEAAPADAAPAEEAAVEAAPVVEEAAVEAPADAE